MLIFNHSLLDSEKFYDIQSIDDISKTPSNSIVRFSFSEKNVELLKFCKDNGISCSIDIKNIEQALIASSLEASYLIVSEQNAKKIQEVAETYLFDSKVLVTSKNIEEFALLGIDGIIIEE